MGRLFAGHGLPAIGGLFGRRRLFSGGRLLSRHRLFADRLPAALLLFLRLLFALGGRRLLLGLKRFGLRNRLAGGRLLPGRRLFGGCGFDLLVLLVLLAQGLWVVVVCRGRLLGRLFGRRLLSLLPLIALLPARLLFLGGCGLFGRCLFGLLLLIALLPARLLFLGWSGLFGRCLFGLLLLLALLPAWLLLLGGLLALGRRCLLFRRGPLALALLFRLRLLLLGAGFGRFALGARRLRQNERG
ncbi:hypothetical protein [Mesorhizobium sp. M0293]|uniref:hypothetical protein n=1 Tax=Mesorhizobium sp. M0293 TaxID=2956930 RepID=UPI00333B98C6